MFCILLFHTESGLNLNWLNLKKLELFSAIFKHPAFDYMSLETFFKEVSHSCVLKNSWFLMESSNTVCMVKFIYLTDFLSLLPVLFFPGPYLKMVLIFIIWIVIRKPNTPYFSAFSNPVFYFVLSSERRSCKMWMQCGHGPGCHFIEFWWGLTL